MINKPKTHLHIVGFLLSLLILSLTIILAFTYNQLFFVIFLLTPLVIAIIYMLKIRQHRQAVVLSDKDKIDTIFSIGILYGSSQRPGVLKCTDNILTLIVEDIVFATSLDQKFATAYFTPRSYVMIKVEVNNKVYNMRLIPPDTMDDVRKWDGEVYKATGKPLIDKYN